MSNNSIRDIIPRLGFYILVITITIAIVCNVAILLHLPWLIETETKKQSPRGRKKIRQIWHLMKLSPKQNKKYLMQCVTFSMKHDNSLIPEISKCCASTFCYIVYSYKISHRAIDLYIQINLSFAETSHEPKSNKLFRWFAFDADDGEKREEKDFNFLIRYIWRIFIIGSCKISTDYVDCHMIFGNF